MEGGTSTREDELLALAVNAELKKRGKKKGSLAVRDPLPVAPRAQEPKRSTFKKSWAKTAGSLSLEDQRKAVEQAIEVFSLLPPGSSYAQHRLKVLRKALDLLNTSQ